MFIIKLFLFILFGLPGMLYIHFLLHILVLVRVLMESVEHQNRSAISDMFVYLHFGREQGKHNHDGISGEGYTNGCESVIGIARKTSCMETKHQIKISSNNNNTDGRYAN